MHFGRFLGCFSTKFKFEKPNYVSLVRNKVLSNNKFFLGKIGYLPAKGEIIWIPESCLSLFLDDSYSR